MQKILLVICLIILLTILIFNLSIKLEEKFENNHNCPYGTYPQHPIDSYTSFSKGWCSNRERGNFLSFEDDNSSFQCPDNYSKVSPDVSSKFHTKSKCKKI